MRVRKFNSDTEVHMYTEFIKSINNKQEHIMYNRLNIAMLVNV